MSDGKVLTKYDIMFFYECCGGVLVNMAVLSWSAGALVVLVGIGLSFELLTASSWTYSPAFRKSYFVVDGTDVSVAAAFSWAGVLMMFSAICMMLFNHVSFTGARWIIPVVIVGLAGNVLETVCLRWGMFTYNNTPVTRMFILSDPTYIWGVPLAVRLGYFVLFGPLCSLFLHCAPV